MTKVHDLSPGLSHSRKEHGHGNRRSDRHIPDAERFPELSVRKVDAGTVPYGSSVARNGRTCWASYHGDRLIAVGATSGEARSKYIDWHVQWRQGLHE
jgi:hypothetical protein